MKPKFYIFALILLIISFNSLSQAIQQSQCRNRLNLNIPSFSFLKDSLLVSKGNGCIVTDVNFIMDTLVHTWISDINVYFQKDNAGSLVINHVGGSGDNFIRTKLDDSAAIPLSSGTPPFTGTYRPSFPLSPFNGISTDGYWRILISDTATGDTGVLKAWCIQLTFTCPTGGIQTVEIPNTYRLYQNYPNPFNPVTKIKYGLPKNGYVKLIVYDELGKEVDVLVNGYTQANTHEAVFDATNLPSGVYYYKLEADGFSETKKMVIVK